MTSNCSKGVIAHYPTVSGAYVDVYDAELTAMRDWVEVHDGTEWTATRISSTAICNGCGNRRVVQETEHPLSTQGPSVADWAVANAQRWAKDHATTCRAMPRPEK